MTSHADMIATCESALTALDDDERELRAEFKETLRQMRRARRALARIIERRREHLATGEQS